MSVAPTPGHFSPRPLQRELARKDDARECLRIRALTRENAFSEQELAALGITEQSWRAGIEDGSCPGYPGNGLVKANCRCTQLVPEKTTKRVRAKP